MIIICPGTINRNRALNNLCKKNTWSSKSLVSIRSSRLMVYRHRSAEVWNRDAARENRLSLPLQPPELRPLMSSSSLFGNILRNIAVREARGYTKRKRKEEEDIQLMKIWKMYAHTKSVLCFLTNLILFFETEKQIHDTCPNVWLGKVTVMTGIGQNEVLSEYLLY